MEYNMTLPGNILQNPFADPEDRDISGLRPHDSNIDGNAVALRRTVRNWEEAVHGYTNRGVQSAIRRAGTKYSQKAGQRISRGHSRRRASKREVRSKKPGIKIDTNLRKATRPPVLVTESSVLNSQQPLNTLGPFIGLADLKAIDEQAKKGHDDGRKDGEFLIHGAPPNDWMDQDRISSNKLDGSRPSLHNHSVFPSSANQDGSKVSRRSQDSEDDLGDESPVLGRKRLVPPPIKTEEDLSPADRPIVIGIAIPSAKTSEHMTSPEPSLDRDPQGRPRRSTDTTPITPGIIVTPAEEDDEWSSIQRENTLRRPASSIYSQYTTYPARDQNSDIPAIPALPYAFTKAAAQSNPTSQNSNRDSATTVFEEDDQITRKSRVLSGMTMFEEDETPTSNPRHSTLRTGAGTSPFTPLAVDVRATRYRSRGWWNVIVSPFLTHFSQRLSIRPADPDPSIRHIPSMPPQPLSKPDVMREMRESWASSSSSEPLKKDHTRHTTLWSDLSAWEDDRERQRSVIHVQAPQSSDEFSNIDFEKSMEAAQNTENQYKYPSSPHHTNLKYPEDTIQDRHQRQSGDSVFSPNDREIPMLLEEGLPERPESHTGFNDHFRVATSRKSENKATGSVTTKESYIEDKGNSEKTSSGPCTSFVSHDQVSSFSSPSCLRDGKDTVRKVHHPPPYSPARRKYFAVLPPEMPSLRGQPRPTRKNEPSRLPRVLGLGVAPRPSTSASRQIDEDSSLSSSNELPPRHAPILLGNIPGSYDPHQRAENHRRWQEKEDRIARKAGGLWRGRCCFSANGCFGRTGASGRKRRRWYIGLIIALVLMVVIVVSLAMTLHRKSPTQVESQWLNLTGFPPIPTGISTIAQPNPVIEQSGCVTPSALWSCALPKEEQGSIQPNDPDQPNWEFQILYRNDSETNATFANVTTGKRDLHWNSDSSGALSKSRRLWSRDDSSDWTSVPSPPSIEDQIFLGNTTDDIVSSLKQGEATPFYISFLSTFGTSSKRLAKRQQSLPDYANLIPPPSDSGDGSAAPADLFPLPTLQPIRLYDRGLDTEHYGFYTYFDRSIFLSWDELLNSTNVEDPVAADANGGSTGEDAAYRCTWSQSRFLVQMWTRQQNSSALLGPPANSTSSASTKTPQSSASTATPSFSRPGSFSYPVTITTDRHGGNATAKMIYCYPVINGLIPVPSNGTLHQEDRTFGGPGLINPAGGFGQVVNVTFAQGGPGGIDGGVGGCECRWQDWVTVDEARRKRTQEFSG